MTEPSAGPRTLAASLAARSDDGLAALLRQRPDLVRLIPEDVAMLAERCASPASVRLAWQRLNRLEQQVLEVMAALGDPMPVDRIVAAMDPEADAGARALIVGALQHCREVALVWGDDDELRVVAALSAQVGPYPCGLDAADRSHRPQIQRYLTDPPLLHADLADAPEGARDALERLLWGPPRGTLPHADRAVSAHTARTPVEWLLARDLLVPSGPDTVVLPRAIALILRGGRYIQEVALPPAPPRDPAATPVSDADAAAGMHALLITRVTARLLTRIDRGSVRLLRSGGMYQRDAAELADQLGLSIRDLALVADTAARAGLIAADHGEGHWSLTRSADAWRVLDEPRQWAGLALAWRDSSAHTPLADSAAEHRILSDGLQSPGVAETRQLALQQAARTPSGAVIGAEQLAESVRWSKPRLDGRDLQQFLAEVLGAAETLGITGRGALSSAGRLLADPRNEPGALAAAVQWPALVDRVILQADLTATAPGPLTAAAEARIDRLADMESTGAGSVYRISEASLRRAMDSGMATAELLAELDELSMTGVPSSLSTVVHDVGRRHGAVRVEAAACVVTSDDDAALAAAMSDKALARLRLRRVAVGVAISPVSPAEVTEALRSRGISAVSAITTGARRPRRLAGPRPVSTQHADEDQLAAAVRAVRAGESARVALAGSQRTQALGPHDLVSALTTAIRDGDLVWLDFSDAAGTRRTRLVEPLTLRAGVLSGFDRREQRVAAIALSRIAGLSRVRPEE